MSDQSDLPSCPFDAREREFIRRKFGVHFGQPSYLADGILLRTWRSGPEKNRPKLPPAVRSMIERGLVELRLGQRGVRGFFTAAGITAMPQLAADRRLINPKTFAHLRLELGLDGPEKSAAG
jgi:hypothetical protein